MNTELKRNLIEEKLKRDPLAVDLQWSLFVAALSSYRHSTVLRPFPPMYYNGSVQNDETRNFKALEKELEKVPYIGIFLDKDKSKDPTDENTIELMHWVLQKSFQLKFCDKETFSDIQQLTGHTTPVHPPSYIFEVQYNDAMAQKFDELQQGRNIIYAYHGSRLENFHSILHFGLNGHLSKNALFGEGTYLSTEPSICLNYAPSGRGWNKSYLGSLLSCIAVCQVIDHPSVKCQVKDSPSRSTVAGSMGGDVPEKYYVVRNNDMIRVKYLMIYSQKPATKQSLGSALGSWLLHHKFTVVILLYLSLLLAVGLYNSKAFNFYIRKYFRR